MSLISPEVASTAIPSPPPSKHRLFYDATTGKWASKNAAGAVTFFSGGDVVGPASAVNGNVVLFDTTTGKLLKDGGTLGTAAFTASTAYDASGAAAAAQAAAVQRANHTGTQLAATVSDFASAADARIALQRGAASGLAELDASGLVPTNRLPALAITSTYAVASEAAQLALVAQEGDVAIRSDINQSYIKNAGTAGTIADWSLLLTPTDAVLSVAGRTGAVVLAKADVGLGSVDNTSDLAKPVSTAQQAALDAKLDDTQASVFGLSLMDDADAATARTTLGLGTAATTAATDYATAAQGTDDRTASGIRTATGVVAVSTATAPAVGQTLVATSATAATWQTPASGSGSPAGTGTEMQYRAGPTTFGAMSGTAWDDTNRALTMTGATVTTSNPIQNLSQTWNAVTVAFTAWTVNITDTASAETSLLFDWKVGGTSQIHGVKDGTFRARYFDSLAGTNLTLRSNNVQVMQFAGGVCTLAAGLKSSAGTETLYGFRRYVAAPGGGGTLSSAFNDQVRTNEGVTVKFSDTLPTAVAGATHTHIVQDIDGIRITAAAGDTIRISDKVTAAAGYVESTTIGSVITLLAINATEWVATTVLGTWTDGTFTYSDASLTTP